MAVMEHLAWTTAWSLGSSSLHLDPVRVTCFFLVLLAVLLLTNAAARSHARLPLPPGPKGLPVLGNTLQIPQEHAWRQYELWAKEYGPVYSLNIAGRTFIVVAGATAAQELLNKRSIKSSDRAPMFMANNLVTKGLHILLRPYDAAYRLHQRMHAPVLAPRATQSYAQVFSVGTKRLLYHLLTSGPVADYHDGLVKSNLKVMYGLIYGINIETGNEQCLRDSLVVQKAFGRVTTPGNYIVDVFPVLNRLPSFLAPWKREAESLWNAERSLHLRNMDHGLRVPGWTFAKQFVQSSEGQQMDRVELAYSLGILLNASFDTTVMQLEWFLVACINHPHCVARAQAELDLVVGRGRMPDMSDKENLPYITAMIEEAMRWRSIIMGGFPHFTTEEDEYDGYRIPKGAVIMPIYSAIDHDASVFEHPEAYIPERFLYGTGPRSAIAAFGFGRRSCTGRNIARNNMFLHAARLLWAFNIGFDFDERGRRIPVDPSDITSDFNTRPRPFPARFEPRGSWATEIIVREWSSAERDICKHMDDIKPPR